MPRTPVTRAQLRAWSAITAAVVLGIITVLVLVVIAQGVHATREQRRESRRVDDQLVASQRAGCERTKLDRGDLATFMESAEAARRRSGDLDVADEYAALAASVRSRIVDCAAAFPR